LLRKSLKINILLKPVGKKIWGLNSLKKKRLTI
jgi:hypothetical protein